MNKNEKKALTNFLFIYIFSTVLLVSVILYIYYKNESKMLKESCNMELSNAAMQIKTKILDSYMKKLEFKPVKLENEDLKYALYDEEKKLIFSDLKEDIKPNFSKSLYKTDKFNYFIVKLNEDENLIKYIVLQTCTGIERTNKLKIFILLTFVLASIFIAFIGYFLSKILLKPVNQRVENMDKFIKDSAHELNTPISVLMTSVSMLKNGKNPDKMMKYILSSSKQISQIYNDIHFSAFNELNEDVKEKFNLKELVEESAEFFTDIAITKNIKIHLKLNDTYIKMDKTKTQKIINNLISNAIKYSKVDSKVLVMLENNIFHVQDFGIGISVQEQKEIFKRYKRGLNDEGGFGIGLDIVKEICDEYKLKLSLESVLEEGSIFSIDFTSILIEYENFNKKDM